jgi:hypothetical protein
MKRNIERAEEIKAQLKNEVRRISRNGFVSKDEKLRRIVAAIQRAREELRQLRFGATDEEFLHLTLGDEYSEIENYAHRRKTNPFR